MTSMQLIFKNRQGTQIPIITIEIPKKLDDEPAPKNIEANLTSDREQRNNKVNDALQEYTNKVICYVLIYLFLFIGCIIVQYILNGSQNAAILWISSYALLIIILVLFFIEKWKKNKCYVLFQAILLVFSCLLEIGAVILAILSPVMFNYEQKFSSQNAYLNNNQLEVKYQNFDECSHYHQNLLHFQYWHYYSGYCDGIIGLTNPYFRQQNDTCEMLWLNYCKNYEYKIPFSYYSDYQFCQDAISFFSLSIYQEKYGIYCNQMLESPNSNFLSDELYKERINYHSGNLCLKKGFYDLNKEYCYPLQYGMMAYAVSSLVFYLILFIILSRRIYKYYLSVYRNKNLALAERQQLQTQN